MTSIPNGFAVRPGSHSDAAAVAALWNRIGARRRQSAPAYSAEDAEHRWATPGFDTATDTRLVWRGADLVGYSQLSDVKEPHVDLFVGLSIDPELEGEDWLADTLLEWCEVRGRKSLLRAPEGTRVVFVAGAGEEDARRQEILSRHGFLLDRTFYRMRRVLESRPPEPQWPDGIRGRPFRPGEDDQGLVGAYREAFTDHYGYLEQPFDVELERWRHWMRADDFDPAFWFLAVEKDEVCGYCCTFPELHGDKKSGLVDEFGVRPAWRRRGIGRALLLTAFRAMYERGLEAVELGVDSDNRSDALGVYTSVGMHVETANLSFVKELRSGRNLVVS